jgi:hypothetical protein
MIQTVYVIVTGRVQGVGYRAWVAQEAETRGLSGRVRNRRHGWVEAFAGDNYCRCDDRGLSNGSAHGEGRKCDSSGFIS